MVHKLNNNTKMKYLGETEILRCHAFKEIHLSRKVIILYIEPLIVDGTTASKPTHIGDINVLEHIAVKPIAPITTQLILMVLIILLMLGSLLLSMVHPKHQLLLSVL